MQKRHLGDTFWGFLDHQMKINLSPFYPLELKPVSSYRTSSVVRFSTRQYSLRRLATASENHRRQEPNPTSPKGNRCAFPWKVQNVHYYICPNPQKLMCVIFRMYMGAAYHRIKQHLRIKTFYRTLPNAVKTQIWIAVSIYLYKQEPEPALCNQ